jgi:Protein of unknown function (DUF2934)
MERTRQAEQAYREAFADFAKKAQHVQTLSAQSNVDARTMEAALLELERAHVQYNQRRDEWVQHLLPGAAVKQAEIERAHADCVRSIATLLWENAGRPEGTASEDWRKAEEIVRQATAA